METNALLALLVAGRLRDIAATLRTDAGRAAVGKDQEAREAFARAHPLDEYFPQALADLRVAADFITAHT